MFENLPDIVAWVFVAANAGRVLGYLPQVIAAWKCPYGAKSVSRMTWGYFAFAHFTGVLYAMLVIHDLNMALVFLGNLLVCCLLVGIVTWKKLRYRRDEHGGRIASRPGRRVKQIESSASPLEA
jgi:uncharacterized protein with PQ loop repeat